MFTPVNQVRLTNVSIIRMKRHGHRFEIACYKNKILNWRSGIETNLDEVLQSTEIFHNVSRGEYAKKETLQKAFATTNSEEICRLILEKGELQVSEKERHAALEQIFLDICNLVTQFAVNPQTGAPLTHSMIEGAIRECGYSIHLDESPKKQALKVINILQNNQPNEIARALMRLKINCSHTHKKKLKEFLFSECLAIFENESIDEYTPTIVGIKNNFKHLEDLYKNSIKSDLTNHEDPQDITYELTNITLEPTVKSNQEYPSVDTTSITNTNTTQKTDITDIPLIHTPSTDKTTVNPPIHTHENYWIQILCSPKFYRVIDDFVIKSLKPNGSLQLISSNVKTITQTHTNTPIHKKADEPVDKNMHAHTNDDKQSMTASPDPPKITESTHIDKTGFMCKICNTDFDNNKNYRAHCKTELHGFNLKRKMNNLGPLNESEFFVLQEHKLDESKPTKNRSNRKN